MDGVQNNIQPQQNILPVENKTAADFPNRVATRIEITGVDRDSVKYTMHLDGGAQLEFDETPHSFFEWVTGDQEAWYDDDIDASYFLDRSATLNFGLSSLALNHFDPRNENLKSKETSLRAFLGFKELPLIQQVSITSVRPENGEFKIRYNTQFKNPAPSLDANGNDSPATLLDWLNGKDTAEAEEVLGFDPKGVKISFNGQSLGRTDLTNEKLIELLGIQVQQCDTVIAERDGAVTLFNLGTDQLSFESADHYGSFISELPADRPYIVEVDGKYYSISKETKVKANGAEDDGTALSALTWDGLEVMDLPVRISQATIEVRDYQDNSKMIYLVWQHREASFKVELGWLPAWNDTIAAIKAGVALKSNQFFFDNELVLNWGDQQVKLDQIDTFEKASRLNPYPLKDVALLTVNAAEVKATISVGENQYEITAEQLKAGAFQIDGAWYKLPAVDEFRLGPSKVCILLSNQELNHIGEPLEFFNQLLQVIQQGAGAIVKKGGEYKFVPAASEPNIIQVSQQGRLSLSVTAAQGEKQVAFPFATYQQLRAAVIPGKGVITGITNLFFPETLFSEIDAKIQSWGAVNEDGKRRVLSKVVFGPKFNDQNRISVSYYSGDYCWRQTTIPSENVQNCMVGKWSRFNSTVGNVRYHYEIPPSAELYLTAQDGSLQKVEWPQGNEAARALEVKKILKTHTQDRGTSSVNPMPVSKIGEAADGSMSLTAKADEHRGTQDYAEVDREIAIDSPQNFFQAATVGKLSLQVGGQWVNLSLDTPVESLGTVKPLRDYLKEKFAPREAIVHPEVNGKLTLDFGAGIGKKELQGEELADFKAAIAANKNFPLIVGATNFSASEAQFRSSLGTKAHPILITEVTFTLPAEKGKDLPGAFKLQNQDPVVAGGKRLGATEVMIDCPAYYLTNNWAGGFPLIEANGTYYQYSNNCTIIVNRSNGSELCRCHWSNQAARQETARRVQENTTKYYSIPRSVCVVEAGNGQYTLQIKQAEGQPLIEHLLTLEQTDFFIDQMRSMLPVSFKIGAEEITVTPSSLYVDLGSRPDNPIKVTSMKLELKQTGKLDLSWSYRKPKAPHNPSDLARYVNTQEYSTLASIIQYLTGMPTVFSSTTKGDKHDTYYQITDNCTFEFDEKQHVWANPKEREAALNQLRALTLTPSGEVQIHTAEFGNNKKSIAVQISHNKTIFTSDVLLGTYYAMAKELNEGRPYTLLAGNQVFTFTPDKVRASAKTLPETLDQLQRGVATAVSSAYVNRDRRTITLVLNDAHYSVNVADANEYDHHIDKINNSTAELPYLLQVNGLILTVDKQVVVDQTPKPLVPREVRIVDSAGTVQLTYNDAVYVANALPPVVDGKHIVTINGNKFSIDPKKVEQYVAPAPQVAGSSKRSVVMWSGGVAVTLLAGLGLYKWARKNPAFGEWVAVHTPNWVKARLGA
jgi:hypothetical protein